MSFEEGEFGPSEIEYIRSGVGRFLQASYAGERFLDLIMGATRALGKNPLPHIEGVLREMGSDIHLVAVPASFFSHFDIEIPYLEAMRCPYGLKVFHGEQWALAQLAQLEITPEENFANLSQTGLLVPKPGTVEARMVLARNN